MPHPNLDNRTAFAADVLHLVDEEHRPLATLVVKATFVILPGGSLARGARQVGLLPAGEVHHPDRPEESSYRHEPEVAPLSRENDTVPYHFGGAFRQTPPLRGTATRVVIG